MGEEDNDARRNDVLNEVIAAILSETYDGGSGGVLKVSEVLEIIKELEK